MLGERPREPVRRVHLPEARIQYLYAALGEQALTLHLERHHDQQISHARSLAIE
jgi:hypothetical protein